MMKYVLRIHARAQEDILVDRLHEAVVAALRDLQPPWKLTMRPTAPEFGRDFNAHVVLTSRVGKGLRGFVNYRMRSGLRDDAGSDDFMDIEFNPNKVNMQYVADTVFPGLIASLNAYFGCVGDQELGLIDFERSRGVNKREQVLRFYPITYFDSLLCQRALNLTPSAALELVEPHVDRAELLGDGLLVIAAVDPVTIDEAENIDRTLAEALSQDREQPHR